MCISSELEEKQEPMVVYSRLYCFCIVLANAGLCKEKHLKNLNHSDLGFLFAKLKSFRKKVIAQKEELERKSKKKIETFQTMIGVIGKVGQYTPMASTITSLTGFLSNAAYNIKEKEYVFPTAGMINNFDSLDLMIADFEQELRNLREIEENLGPINSNEDMVLKFVEWFSLENVQEVVDCIEIVTLQFVLFGMVHVFRYQFPDWELEIDQLVMNCTNEISEMIDSIPINQFYKLFDGNDNHEDKESNAEEISEV